MSGHCNVEALDVFVGKWKPAILYHLSKNETLRFSELQKLIPEVTKKMLTMQLRDLEHHDIIHRKVYAQIPPKVEYSLTNHGKSVISILDLMHEWGSQHLEHLNQLYGEKKEGTITQ